MATVSYMLRRVLAPWNTEAIVDETVAWCRAQRVDEIMWITECSGMYKELLPLADILPIVDRLRLAKERTEAAGLLFSINPLTTLGHGEYGNDVASRHPGMEMMVDFTGKLSRACACPLSPVWQTLMRETFALYATTHPVRLWIEDDFRYFNHTPAVRFGCYCPRHVAEFGCRVKAAVTRDELVAAVLRPGEPHPWRALWLDVMAQSLEEVASGLRKAVDAVSPETELGWMSTNPGRHEVEGRRVGRQMEAFAGAKSAAIRMTTTHFRETGPLDLLIEDEALKKIVPQLPARTTRCTEIETIPHSAYTVSAARMAAQIEWACILGVPHHTLNIFDYLCTPLAESPAYDDMLRNRKEEFNAFAQAFAALSDWRGVGIPGDPDSAKRVRTAQGKDIVEFMAREGGWADPLRAFGLPVHFTRNEAVTAVTGQGLTCMDDGELAALFCRGVLLDASALQTLQDRGRADLAGVRIADVIQARSRPMGPEELTDPAFGGAPFRYTWALGMTPIAVLALEGARPISRILDADARFLCPGVTLHENALGGRVAVAPFYCDGNSPDPYQKGTSGFFYSPWRRRQFHALLRWLARGPAPLVVHSHGWTLPHRADGPRCAGLAAMNITADAWNGLEMTCRVEGALRRVDWLDIDGTRRTVPASAWRQEGPEVSLKIDAQVPPLRAVAAFLEWEKR